MPVLLTSWALGATAWVLVWWVLPTVQGLATAAAGGQFIGLSLPPWTQPWALVNQPSVGFAATSTALWVYWLAPFLAAAALAAILPQLPPGPSLAKSLFFLHTGTAAALLGLGWLPGVGGEDGLLAGLSRFFRQDPALWTWGMALLGGLLVGPAVRALLAPLWHLPGGPTPGRRALAWLGHLGVPAGVWVAWVGGYAPSWPKAALLPFLAALAGSLLWALGGKPPHPLRQRELYAASPWLAWALALLLVAPSWVVFLPEGGKPKGYLWGVERMTSNVRPGIVKVTLPLAPAAPRGSSAPGS